MVLHPHRVKRQLLQHMHRSRLTLSTVKHNKPWLHCYDTAYLGTLHWHTPIKTWQLRGLRTTISRYGAGEVPQDFTWEKYKEKHIWLFFLLPILCKRKQAVVWNPNDPVLCLLVKGISYFLCVSWCSLQKHLTRKRVWIGRTSTVTHHVNKHDAWTQERKQNGSVGGLEANRTKCRKKKPHSVTRITLFFWPRHITTLWPQRSGSSQGTLRPPIPIREIREESRQEQRGVS